MNIMESFWKLFGVYILFLLLLLVEFLSFFVVVPPNGHSGSVAVISMLIEIIVPKSNSVQVGNTHIYTNLGNCNNKSSWMKRLQVMRMKVKWKKTQAD